jgi:cell wall-associated NlpC family hydrolase
MSIHAIGLVGTPYRYGGNTPEGGFDCSGFVRWVALKSVAIRLPRSAAEMGRMGRAIDPDEIAPGDLVFFNTSGHPYSHVGIYVGQQRFAHAPSTGGTVRMDLLNKGYWGQRFTEVRRIVNV